MLEHMAKTEKARFDADRTAKPIAQILGHVRSGDCQGPGATVPDTYDDGRGTRIALASTPKAPKEPSLYAVTIEGVPFELTRAQIRAVIRSLKKTIAAKVDRYVVATKATPRKYSPRRFSTGGTNRAPTTDRSKAFSFGLDRGWAWLHAEAMTEATGEEYIALRIVRKKR